MTRKEEALESIDSINLGCFGEYYEGVAYGVKWADEHPDEEKIKRISDKLSDAIIDWINTRGSLNVKNFIIEHWND